MKLSFSFFIFCALILCVAFLVFTVDARDSDSDGVDDAIDTDDDNDGIPDWDDPDDDNDGIPDIDDPDWAGHDEI